MSAPGSGGGSFESYVEAFLRGQQAREILPGSITELVTQLGGPGRGHGTSRAAEELGVTIKAVQRYVRYEAGERGPNVRPPDTRLILERRNRAEGRAAFERHVKEAGGLAVYHFHGVICVFSGKMAAPDCRERRIDRADSDPIVVPYDKLGNFFGAFHRGDDLEAAREFEAPFLEAYGMGPQTVGYSSIHEVTTMDVRLAGGQG